MANQKSLDKKKSKSTEGKKDDFVEMREGYFSSIMALGGFISTLPEEAQIFKVEKRQIIINSITNPWYILYYLPESKL
jgi:hypothetical protein